MEAGSLWYRSCDLSIGGVQHGDDFHVFYSETEVGPVTRQLYDRVDRYSIWRYRSTRRMDCQSRLKRKCLRTKMSRIQCETALTKDVVANVSPYSLIGSKEAE